MDLGIIIALASVAFAGGIWFHRTISRLDNIDKKLVPLIFIHKEELIKYYLERDIVPNPNITPHKKYLIDKLEAGTISYSEAQELSSILRREEREARRAGNIDALIAILGLIALVAIIASLSRQ